jgi:hypothetical protein
MPRREILTSSQRMQLLVFSDDEGELIRRYTLAKADLAFVRQHRGDHNRLGIAIQMCSLRFPGRVLAENERPPDRLLNLMATQLGISIGAWNIYAQRDETRREHLLELLRDGPIWDQALPGDSAWLESTALQTTQGIVLVLFFPSGVHSGLCESVRLSRCSCGKCGRCAEACKGMSVPSSPLTLFCEGK